MATHEFYMHRCLALASQGLGRVKSNPLVGCVIVENNEIIGEGYHEQYGGPHAEVNAIAAVQDKSRLQRATLYVNLEPCHHYGKTPPCSLKILEVGIPHVVIGQRDPFVSVDGKGIQHLVQNGVHVEMGILEPECRALNKRFNTFHEKKRPYIILKWAQSADHFIDQFREHASQLPKAISCPESKQLLHQWRSEEMGILVGRKTIELDNPQLNVRLVEGDSPLRMVIDLHDRLTFPSTMHIFDQSQPTLLFHSSNTPKEKMGQLEWVNISITNTWNEIFDILVDRGITSIIVEGGCITLQYLIDQQLWDEARVFTSPEKLNHGIKAPTLVGKSRDEMKVGKDILQYFYRT